MPGVIGEDDHDHGQEDEPPTMITMDDHEDEVDAALRVVIGEPPKSRGKGKAPEICKSQFRNCSGGFPGYGLAVDIEDIVESGTCFQAGIHQRATRLDAQTRKTKKVAFDLVGDGS